jgi:hypothetical protein
VEGYAGWTTPPTPTSSRSADALAVRSYLLEKFGLRPNYVGVMEMGRVESTADSGRAVGRRGAGALHRQEEDEAA